MTYLAASCKELVDELALSLPAPPDGPKRSATRARSSGLARSEDGLADFRPCNLWVREISLRSHRLLDSNAAV
jgi:hypothetical protein